MVISAYQVNNVLRVYGDQLRQNRAFGKPKMKNSGMPDKINISAEAKRKAIIEKISANIVGRITDFGPNDHIEKEVFKKLENEYGGHLTISKNNPKDLVFKEIDENGETVNSLSVEDSEILRYKLEAITKEAVNNNMV